MEQLAFFNPEGDVPFLAKEDYEIFGLPKWQEKPQQEE